MAFFSKTTDPRAALKPFADRITTADAAVAGIGNGAHVFVGSGCATPLSLVRALETMPSPPR